jgi:hypothetical protein
MCALIFAVAEPANEDIVEGVDGSPSSGILPLDSMEEEFATAAADPPATDPFHFPLLHPVVPQ